MEDSKIKFVGGLDIGEFDSNTGIFTIPKTYTYTFSYDFCGCGNNDQSCYIVNIPVGSIVETNFMHNPDGDVSAVGWNKYTRIGNSIEITLETSDTPFEEYDLLISQSAYDSLQNITNGIDSEGLLEEFNVFFDKLNAEANANTNTHHKSAYDGWDDYGDWDPKTNGNVKQNDNPKKTPVNNYCLHQERYRNLITKNMDYWVCYNCGKDLGNVSDEHEVSYYKRIGQLKNKQKESK